MACDGLVAVPTAQVLRAEAPSTPVRMLVCALPVTFGLGTTRHDVPFQCSVRVFWAAPVKTSPTAHAFCPPIAATLISSVPWAPLGLGLVAFFQVLPFQRKIKDVLTCPGQAVPKPTAQALVADTADTENN